VPHRIKPHLVALKRYQTSTGRDLAGLRLDRNERVHPLPSETIAEILAQFRPEHFAAHPESDFFYDKLSTFLGMPRDHIYVLNGITDGIHHLYFTLTEAGDNVVALDPTYPMYAIYAQLNALEYRRFSYGADLKPDWATLDAALDERTAMVVVANPNLPIESAFTRDQIRQLASKAAACGAVLVVDEAYHYFGADTVIDLVNEIPNLIVLRTFSKAFGLASARIGYLVSNPELVDYIAKTRSLVESNTFSMGIAAYMLDNPAIMEAHVGDVKRGAKLVQQGLDKLGLRWHGGDYTNGIMIFLDGVGSADQCVAYMRDRNIYIRGSFAAPYDKCVRVSIGREDDMRCFLNAFGEWIAQARSLA